MTRMWGMLEGGAWGYVGKAPWGALPGLYQAAPAWATERHGSQTSRYSVSTLGGLRIPDS